ncbi:MAG: helix-turn-helix domain-containing protein [Candidatus Binataceae bacterium]
MNILGKLIATRRKQLGLQQQQLAACLKNRGEEALSATYLNYIENGRGIPSDYLIEQIAARLKLPPEVLYFWARRMPPDVVPTEYIDANRIVAAFRLFRAALKRDSARTSAGVAR